MKKIVLSLAGVLAATAFAPEAAAVPAFARQTGMACTACHFQHFPVLNSFGRAFKAAGYTMMGAQGKVEGEHLSIPDTLNMSMLIKLRYQKDNTAGTANTKIAAPTRGEGRFDFPDEFVILSGGRVAENVGYFVEMTMGGSAATMGSPNFRLPFAFDAGGAKLSVVPFWTADAGPGFGYELSSNGIIKANRWTEHGPQSSAVAYVAGANAGGAAGGGAFGFAFVAQNDMGYINLTKFASNSATGNGRISPESNYYRLAVTPTVGDWSLVGGIGGMSGSSWAGVAATENATKQTFIDVQGQGVVAGKDLSLYAAYAKAPCGTAAAPNEYNPTACGAGAPGDRKAFSIGADYSFIPHVLSVGAAYLNGKDGTVVGADGDNVWTVSAVYDLYQNVALHAVYSKYSGSAHTAATVNNLTTLMLEAAW